VTSVSEHNMANYQPSYLIDICHTDNV